MALWIVGGVPRLATWDQKEWLQYKTAAVVRVDDDGTCHKVFEYVTPPENRPPESSIVFKAATFTDSRAILCTQTEVVICRLPDFEVQQVISLPCFNDVHHVTIGPNGDFFVACTGLDAVAQVSPDGELRRLTDVLGGHVWDRFSPEMDYRKVPTTKPHLSHPNYVFFLDGEPWVTRFHQQDAVPLHDIQRERIVIAENRVHDGYLAGDKVYFTCVDGHIVQHDRASGVVSSYDLNVLNPDASRPLGWCRGILPTQRGIWVGFSRIRHTALRKNLSWLWHGFKLVGDLTHLPTRVARYSADCSSCVEEISLEEVGLAAVFSIHEVTEHEVTEHEVIHGTVPLHEVTQGA